MLEIFYPDHRVRAVDDIPFENLYACGYRGLIFDIDNTLVPHGAPADQKAVDLFERLKNIGYRFCLLSNNKESRVAPFAQAVGSEYICKANKPFKGGYFMAMDMMGTDAGNTIFIGDQLFTDVWGAVRIGMMNILVAPIDPKEEIQIVLKRYPERIVLRSWRKWKKQLKNV